MSVRRGLSAGATSNRWSREPGSVGRGPFGVPPPNRARVSVQPAAPSIPRVATAAMGHAAVLAGILWLTGRAPHDLPEPPASFAMVFAPIALRAAPAAAPVEPAQPAPPPAARTEPPAPAPQPATPEPKVQPVSAPQPAVARPEVQPVPPSIPAPAELSVQTGPAEPTPPTPAPPVPVAVAPPRAVPAPPVTHPVPAVAEAALPLPPPPPPFPPPRRIAAEPARIAATSRAAPPPPQPAQPSLPTAGTAATAGPETAMVPPRPIAAIASDRPPVYPALARRRGEQGRVVLRVSVDANGLPLAVTVGQTSGHVSLDDAAAAAVRRWRFVPATEDGRPVRAVAEVPVQFRLQD